MNFNLNDCSELLTLTLQEVKKLKLHSPLLCDHICYRVESLDEYNLVKLELEKIASLAEETDVRGRLICIYKLHTPLQFEELSIDCIELPQPKTGSFYASGWEHSEIVVKDLHQLIKDNPDFEFKTKGISRELNPEIKLKINDQYAIKFHPLHILEVIEIERAQGK